MVDLTISFDPGSSMSKVFYTTRSFKPQLLLMEPQVARVPLRSLEAYEEKIKKLGNPAPERVAWIEYKRECRAVGFLVTERFHCELELELPKFELALYKTLAIVGVIAQKKNLANGSRLRLGILFPFKEYEDRHLFESLIVQALKNFRFRGVERSFELDSFVCRPEGFGVLSRGRAPGRSLKEQVVAVIIVGHRDASVLLMNRGVMKGFTTNLGFHHLVASVASLTCVNNPLELAAAICQAGPKIKPEALEHLARSRDAGLRSKEIARLITAINTAKEEYWLALSQWVGQRIPVDVDEVLFTGGAAYYLYDEFNVLFRKPQKNWCEELAQTVSKTFLTGGLQHVLSHRLTDNSGNFYYLCGTAMESERTEIYA